MKDVTHLAALFGDRIRKRRQELDMSVETLSYFAQVENRHLRRIEKGDGNPTLVTMARIAYALDTTVSALTADITRDDAVLKHHQPTTASLEAAHQRMISREAGA